MKSTFARFLVCTAAALTPYSYAFSQVIVQHSGAADPVTEGFTLSSWNEVQLGPVVGDLGRDAWKIHTRDSWESGSYYYRLTPQEIAGATTYGWEYSASLRFVEMSEFTRVTMAFLTEEIRFRLALSSNNAGKFIVSGDGIQAFVLDVDPLEYHHFRMAYDAELEYASLWIDGVEQVKNIPPPSVPGATASVSFGASGEDVAYSHWNEFSFAVVPEPAAVALLAGMGALLVAGGVRWRRRKVGPK